MDEEIRELLAQTEHTRLQFLRAELETCRTALELGRYQFSVGNSEVAQKEVAVVNTGILTIEHFLSKLPAGERAEFEPKMAKLKSEFDSLKALLA